MLGYVYIYTCEHYRSDRKVFIFFQPHSSRHYGFNQMVQIGGQFFSTQDHFQFNTDHLDLELCMHVWVFPRISTLTHVCINSIIAISGHYLPASKITGATQYVQYIFVNSHQWLIRRWCLKIDPRPMISDK